MAKEIKQGAGKKVAAGLLAGAIAELFISVVIIIFKLENYT